MHSVICLIIAFVVATNVEAQQSEEKWHVSKQEWELFKETHYKAYENEDEEHSRRQIYLMNKKRIERHNAKYAQGLVTFELGVNQFTDMLDDEVTSTMNGFISNLTEFSSTGATFISNANLKVPKSMDWRKIGAVTAVQNQGQCGSCWAFSACGAVEGQTFLKTKKLVALSKKNLVDCATNNGGCGGGHPIRAFEYIYRNNGIDTESSYPYKPQRGYCRYNPRYVGATVEGYETIPKGNERALMEAIATVGPISVALDGSQFSFSAYRGGIYYEPRCNGLNHAVLAVGYGTDQNGMDYWILKNSYGTRWGEEGYMRIVRNKNNHCGVASDASYPVV